jgi:dihydrofolate reductase
MIRNGMSFPPRMRRAEASWFSEELLGSGTIVSQLTQEGLIDEFQIVVIPIILGKGRTLFEGVKNKLKLKRTKTRNFKNGNVFSTYEPARS